MYHNKGRLSKSEKDVTYRMLLRNDCARLGLNLLEDKFKCSNLLVQLSRIFLEINKILIKEIGKQDFENYRQLNIFSEYKHLPWALRLLLELPTSYKTKLSKFNLWGVSCKRNSFFNFL